MNYALMWVGWVSPRAEVKVIDLVGPKRGPRMVLVLFEFAWASPRVGVNMTDVVETTFALWVAEALLQAALVFGAVN